MDLSNKRVLVTGADGFIGSHLVERLMGVCGSVKAFVQYNSFNTWGWLDQCSESLKKEIKVFAGDIRDPYGVNKSMEDVDVVFHLAALIAIPYSYHSPDTYVDTNVKGTLNVVQAARERQIDKVLHTSTSEVYGTAKFVPITEAHPLQGQSPYSASKIGADQMALSFYRSFETPIAVVRPFNTYGPRQSARAIIPTIITQLLAGRKEIKLGLLTPTRDLNYVEDTVNGFIAMAESDAVLGEVVNIGSNFEISMGEVVDLLKKITGSEARIITDDERVRPVKSEVERLWADNSKALNMLDWSPLYASRKGLTCGLQKTVDWFSKEENCSVYKSDIYNI